jgi:hypothetical protein
VSVFNAEIQQQGPAPLGYTLAPGQTVEVDAATAIFDGTGASGDFVPALAFYANNGRLIARAIVPSTVTAGDEAEVSFFPSAPVSAGSGGPFTPPWFWDGAPIQLYAGDAGTAPLTSGTGQKLRLPGLGISPGANDTLFVYVIGTITSVGTSEFLQIQLPTQPNDSAIVYTGWIATASRSQIVPAYVLATGSDVGIVYASGADTRFGPPAEGAYGASWPFTQNVGDTYLFQGFYRDSGIL